jgi:splicing factor 3B subunit 4
LVSPTSSLPLDYNTQEPPPPGICTNSNGARVLGSTLDSINHSRPRRY